MYYIKYLQSFTGRTRVRMFSSLNLIVRGKGSHHVLGITVPRLYALAGQLENITARECAVAATAVCGAVRVQVRVVVIV